MLTLQYDTATFLGGYSPTTLILDLYFGTQHATLFGFALLTVEWQHEMSEAFSYRMAVQLDPTGLDHRIEIGFSASAVVP